MPRKWLHLPHQWVHPLYPYHPALPSNSLLSCAPTCDRDSLLVGGRVQAVPGYQAPTPLALVPMMPPAAGYSAAHMVYAQQKSNAARHAQQVAPAADTVNCTIYVVYLPEGKPKPVTVGDVLTGMGAVHISLGVAQLRQLALEAILPLWAKYTQSTCSFPADAQLINDVSALLPHAVKKGRSYQQLKLAFRITFRDYENMMTCMAEGNVPTMKSINAARTASSSGMADLSDEEMIFTEVASSMVPKRKYADTRAQGQPTTPPRKFGPPAEYKSPERRELRAALANTADITFSGAAQLLYQHRPGKFYPLERFKSFEECLRAAPLSIKTLGEGFSAELLVGRDMLGEIGAFKAAFPGNLRGPARVIDLVKFLGTDLCVKKAINQTAKGKNFTLMSNADALVMILKEVRNWQWASSLQLLVESFIARELGRMATEGLHMSGAPQIPTFSFVDMGIFVFDDQEKAGGVVLLETKLDLNLWCKYIGNADTRVLRNLKGVERRDAEFLSFCQHVQWVKTDGQVFVADYQGADRILTDPQILTASEFTNNFADGNVLAGWESMTAHHKCNDYCKFFGLVSPSLQRDELAQRRAAVAKAAPGSEEPAPAVEG
ncbi:hypothetical protein AURDEDRAFT_177063 [Auricularia subglabra TFB-10046 SS5]|uniref:Alpha-type protein kinase domain-containing protein n=1 Tax=Auricularia subglabra (strain TFB-10046 / SS5) TaxID=717982 RepID=J0D535_AURST|nr:hypothetical protein AURDEDRAFT_177063 [Auricularia subglabra TFB-10046 SS5]